MVIVSMFKCHTVYDPDIALRMIQYSDVVYCGDKTHGGLKPLQQWSCEPCKALSGYNSTSSSIMSDSTRQTFALAGLEVKPKPAIVLVFRGSVLPVNFIDDDDEKLVNWWTPGQIHEGFLRSYGSLRAQVFTQIHNLIKECKGCPIYITGHSLGAAQSTLAAVDLASNFTNSRFYQYNFGDPRVGTKKFVEFYNKMQNLETWRVTHRYDIVPQKIKRTNGYTHIKTEVYYPQKTGLEYNICDGSGEDPTCEDSVPESKLNWNDHNIYLDHSMWCCMGDASSQCSFPFPTAAPITRTIGDNDAISF